MTSSFDRRRRVRRRPVAAAVLAVTATVLAVAATLAAATRPAAGPSRARATPPLGPEDVLRVRLATSAVISPDGRHVAYTVAVARPPDAEPGGSWIELHVADVRTGRSRPYVTGRVRVGHVRWRPDGRAISFTMKRGDDAKTQVWTIPLDGGEAAPTTHAPDGVITYAWHPDGRRIFFAGREPKSKRRRRLEQLGYGFVFYEEDLRNRNLYVEDVASGDASPRLLVDSLNVWSIRVSSDGRWIGFGASPHDLVDERYVDHHLWVFDDHTGAVHRVTRNPGKFGTYAFSPDGSHVAWTGALTRRDHAVSQVFVQPVEGGQPVNLTPPKFRGHVVWADWRDDRTIVYRADEGVWTTLTEVRTDGSRRRVRFHSRNERMSFFDPTLAADRRTMAFLATSPEMPRDVWAWNGRGRPRRLTTLNPWLSGRDLARCEPVTYRARDGWPVEGLLYYPVGYREGTRYPLVVIVHGGPESHYAYSWRSGYFLPPQVLAGRGYAVFLPNYRASTGYGLPHTEAHHGDPAGVEFDDVADGIRFLARRGIADSTRVGLGGGSYGGFAAAWFATYYTRLVRAAVMFVGISDLISKRGTTDIPYEELYVHSGRPLEEMWKLSLERSPIYWAHRSRTATLIIGGAADTRVHPSQSLELYRRMKMNHHPAVRLVQYPGEGHGNRRMPGRRDVLYRTLRWMDWYVRDARPIEDGLPPVDISDSYPIELPARDAP